MKNSTLAQMRCLAQQRGGECVSRRYVSSKIPLRWRCRRGHQWNAMPTNVSRGSWCPACAHRKRLTLAEMRALASRRGGECISDQHMNNETKLWWRCSARHEWEADPALVKGGSWCPYCAHNQRLELKVMQRLARKRGGKCLSTRYINNRHPISWECKRRHRWKASPANVKGGKRRRGTWCLECYNLRRQFRPRHTIERMKDLAHGRGGLCLSEEYINSKSKLLRQCDKGHCWRAVPVTVRGGSWCPVCARNRKLTLEEFRSLASRKGGRCLSDHYTNKSTPLRWQCALGHRGYAQPGRIRRGAWCAKCANLRRGSQWRPGHDRTKLRLSSNRVY